jgi:hypothetical protein
VKDHGAEREWLRAMARATDLEARYLVQKIEYSYLTSLFPTIFTDNTIDPHDPFKPPGTGGGGTDTGGGGTDTGGGGTDTGTTDTVEKDAEKKETKNRSNET